VLLNLAVKDLPGPLKHGNVCLALFICAALGLYGPHIRGRCLVHPLLPCLVVLLIHLLAPASRVLLLLPLLFPSVGLHFLLVTSNLLVEVVFEFERLIALLLQDFFDFLPALLKHTPVHGVKPHDFEGLDAEVRDSRAQVRHLEVCILDQLNILAHVTDILGAQESCQVFSVFLPRELSFVACLFQVL